MKAFTLSCLLGFAFADWNPLTIKLDGVDTKLYTSSN